MGKPIIRTIRGPEDLQGLINFLEDFKDNRSEYPFTVTIKPGEPKRSEKQNRLLYQWYMDAEAQGDQTASESRAECKLRLGVPILRAENDDFRIQYDEIIKPLSYIEKLALMLPPIELPVTSLMSVKQKTKFLDQVWVHYSGIGIKLTDPSMLGLEDCCKRGGDNGKD